MGKAKNSSLIQKQISTYLSRYAYPIEHLEGQPVAKDLGIIITIPCYNEPDLLHTLDSLRNCVSIQTPAEIIVLINHSVRSDNEIINQNDRTFRDAIQWIDKNSTVHRKFHVIYLKDFPEKHAGVGLARKVVMDEALRRLIKSQVYDGVILGLDADCLCDPNYFVEIERYFKIHPCANGATIYFEHPFIYSDIRQSAGISSYELHLRYLVQALRYTKFPYAFHSLGSCMAVRANVYAKQGGMNKRKAGEDFYFLQKIIPLGDFGEINTTRIFPSGRISNRVPFGTGKAMLNWSKSNKTNFYTYNPIIFEELRKFYSDIHKLAEASNNDINDFYFNLPVSLRKFIGEEEWIRELSNINLQANTLATFRYNFFQWMNGLKTLKFIHYTRDKFYDNVPINHAYQWLKEKIGLFSNNDNDVIDCLTELRNYDKLNPYHFKKTVLKN